MVKSLPNKVGEAFLTVHGKFVKKSKTLRRGAPHIDGNYLKQVSSWGSGGGNGWKVGENGMKLTSKEHALSYENQKGGMLIGFGADQLTSGEEKLPTLLWGFFKLFVGWKLIPDGKKTSFYHIDHRRKKHPEEFNDDIAQLFDWLKAGKLKPEIADRRPLIDAEKVHKQLDNAEIIGKVVLINNNN